MGQNLPISKKSKFTENKTVTQLQPETLNILNLILVHIKSLVRFVDACTSVYYAYILLNDECLSERTRRTDLNGEHSNKYHTSGFLSRVSVISTLFVKRKQK